jgi:RNA polymerase sigma-70 factor (ECF subfamily)
MGAGAEDLDRLYREVGPHLLAWLVRRHGDPTAAEDLLQETFAAAVRHPERLWRAVSQRAYLFGIARNLSVDSHRQARATTNLTENLAMEPEATVDPRVERMREAIAKLNPALREVLELRLQAELSYEEIATALGVPVGTVRSRLHHAVKQLRQMMERLGDETKSDYGH